MRLVWGSQLGLPRAAAELMPGNSPAAAAVAVPGATFPATVELVTAALTVGAALPRGVAAAGPATPLVPEPPGSAIADPSGTVVVNEPDAVAGPLSAAAAAPPVVATFDFFLWV